MVEAPFRLIQASLPHMYARGYGRVVNISSAHGLPASPFKVGYVTAKHALEGMSKVVALEGGALGVTSNCINPGYVRTPLVEKQITDQAHAHSVPETDVVKTVLLPRSAVKRLAEGCTARPSATSPRSRTRTRRRAGRDEGLTSTRAPSGWNAP